jgi:DNA polymerase-3 subunit alpha/error-prone DNA polymerase
MFFGTWVDHEGTYFDTTHFPDNLLQYPFQGGGCYLLLGTVELITTTLTILKMAKLPLYLIHDIQIRKDHQFLTQRIKEDVSSTQEHLTHKHMG